MKIEEYKRLTKKRKSKYKNEPIEIDGHKFPSIKEANYYCDLKILKAAGIVTEFDKQVEFVLIPAYKNANGESIHAVKYIADFIVTYKDGHTEIVDVKGFRTKDYKLKKKLFEYQYRDRGFVLKEV